MCWKCHRIEQALFYHMVEGLNVTPQKILNRLWKHRGKHVFLIKKTCFPTNVFPINQRGAPRLI